MGVGFATHSEYAVVPVNLTAKLPPGVDYREAAFAAIACIAMQGARRLELAFTGLATERSQLRDAFEHLGG